MPTVKTSLTTKRKRFRPLCMEGNFGGGDRLLTETQLLPASITAADFIWSQSRITTRQRPPVGSHVAIC
jgi:hypothetical protein